MGDVRGFSSLPAQETMLFAHFHVLASASKRLCWAYGKQENLLLNFDWK